MSKPAARTFAYGQGKAKTMGHWSKKHFVTKGEHEQWDAFLLRQRPSTMTPVCLVFPSVFEDSLRRRQSN